MAERLSFLTVGRGSACAAFLGALLTVQAGYGQVANRGYEPPSYHDGETHYEKSEYHFGRFTVARYIEDCRDVAMLDSGCWLTKEAKLEWRDSSGAIGFLFVDNGASVEFKAEGKSADGKTMCLSRGVLVGYDPKPSKTDNWYKLQPFIHRQLLGCTAISPASLHQATKEMDASGADYESAANAWKSVSVELFGANGRRCIAERMMKPFTMPPRFECVKYSQTQMTGS
ncbi:MAG: hypothetical protein EOO77_17305 [Oxalobacteraceae bacterium]|nr:MAG: hypothetical protein EOO77_17305 [Oxalobacteraceae bacterium]